MTSRARHAHVTRIPRPSLCISELNTVRHGNVSSSVCLLVMPFDASVQSGHGSSERAAFYLVPDLVRSIQSRIGRQRIPNRLIMPNRPQSMIRQCCPGDFVTPQFHDYVHLHHAITGVATPSHPLHPLAVNPLQVAEMKTKAQFNQKMMTEIAQENKLLLEPLAEALKEVEELKYDLKDCEKDKMSLKNAQSRLKLLESRHKNLISDHQKLEDNFKSVQVRLSEIV